MSYNGSGTFNINTAGQPVVTGTVISSTAFNALTADLGTGLSTAITKNGQTTVTANIPFNGFKLTGIGVATASGDALTYGQAATVTTLVASTSITDSGLTSGRVTYAGTAGLLQDSANLTFSGSALAVTGTLTSTLDATIHGLTVGLGGGSAARNTAFGDTALYTNSTGTDNTAIGSVALYTNTGSTNTAVGRAALYTNGSGSSNTAVGYGSLQSNTTASNNTAVGYQAGYSNTTGTQNIFFGYKAGYTADASYSTLIGYQAAYLNTGERNTAIGRNTINGSGAGSYNTAIGFNTAGSLTSGSYNAFVGYASGQDITSGSKNTIIGAYSGNQGGLDIRTASNYIVLSDGDGNPRFYSDSSGGLISPGTLASGAFLWVKSGAYIGASGSSTALISQASNGSGTTTYYIGNQSITTISDVRLKENVVDTTRNAIEILEQLRVVDHTWNDPSDQCENNRNSRGVWMGLIAQEAQPVIPWLVNKPTEDVDEDGNPQYWHMDYGYSVPLLIKAIQEQQAIITALTTRITALEAK